MLGNFKNTHLLFKDDKQINKRSMLYPEGCHLHGHDHKVYGLASHMFLCLDVCFFNSLQQSIRFKRNTHLELLFLMVCVTQLHQKCGEVPLSYSRSHIIILYNY